MMRSRERLFSAHAKSPERVTGEPTTLDDHDPLSQNIYEVLKTFIDEIGNRECASHFDKVLRKKHYLKGRHLLQEPERFIEDHLVFPLLEKPLAHGLRPRPKQYAPRWPKQGGVPDFCLTTLPVQEAIDADVRIFGEVKPPKKMKRARKEMREYLNKDVDLDALAILTDGFDWELWVRPRGERVEEDEDPYAIASLRDPLRATFARNLSVDTSRAYNVRERIDANEFSSFTAASVLEVVETEFVGI